LDSADHLFSAKNPDLMLDLSIGAPGPEILTKLPEIFSRGTTERMKGELSQGTLFQYGPEQGIVSFRNKLAQFLTNNYGDKVESDELIVTTGATSGLALTASILVDRKATVFVENPTYFIALNILRGDLGLNVVPIDLAGDGIDCDKLEAAVAKYRDEALEKESGRFSCMFYTIPTFHNPTGICYSETVGRKVLSIAEKYNMLVICDDVYNLLKYEDSVPRFSRLKAMCGKENKLVISNGTFSKILSPGIRLGWLEVPTSLVSRFTNCGFLLSGGAINNYTSGIIAQLLQDGDIQNNLNFLRSLYGERMQAVHDYLANNLPAGWTVSHAKGGYFLWVATDQNVKNFCEILQEKDVNVLNGSRATPNADITDYASADFSHCFRISIAYYSKDKLLKACKLICNAATKM